MPRRIKHGGRTWRQRKGDLADHWLNVKACANCGSPQREGWVCIFCGWGES